VQLAVDGLIAGHVARLHGGKALCMHVAQARPLRFSHAHGGVARAGGFQISDGLKQVGEAFFGDAGHGGAAIGAALDQTERAELAQRLAHRRA